MLIVLALAGDSTTTTFMCDFLRSREPKLEWDGKTDGRPSTVAGRDKWWMNADKSNPAAPHCPHMVVKALSSKAFVAVPTSLAPIILAGWSSRVRA